MATVAWCGGAPVVEHVGTITIANTWAANDTLTVTINGKAMVLTIGATATTTQVATELAAAWEGSALGTGYSVNFKGTEVPEFYELIATVSGSVVTLTERTINDVTEGKSFTVAATESTAGTGTATYATVTAGTGPHTYTNTANWAGLSLPANTDTIVFQGPYACKYLLDVSGTLTTCTIRVMADFPQLGLPRFNDSIELASGADGTYEEYRDQYLKTNTGGTITLYVGEGEGDGPTLVRVDSQTSAMNTYVFKTGTALIDNAPVVFCKTVNASSSVDVFDGSAGAGIYPDEAASIGGGVSVNGANATFLAGPLAVVDAVTCFGGTVNIYNAIGSGGTLNASDAGTINVFGLPATNTVLRAYGGTINLLGRVTTLGGVYISKGTTGNIGVVSFGSNQGGGVTLTLTTVKIYSAGCVLNVPGYRALVVTNDILLATGLTPDDVTLVIPSAHASTTAKIKLEAQF